MRIAFTNIVLFTGEEFLRGVCLLTGKGIIEGIVYEEDLPYGYEVVDLNGNFLAPAFIDLQIYGGKEKLFSAELSREAIEATRDYCREGGTSHFLLTLATNEDQVLEKAIDVAYDYLQQGDTGFLGLHLEGPWINPEKRGAHIEKYVAIPSAASIKKLLQRKPGVVKMVTLAPEMVDEDLVRLIQELGILISAGHSNASYQQAMSAFEKIPLATHLFNAMSPLQSRAPGMVGAIYDHPAVKASIVADGVHVDFNAIRISKKILGPRLFLITDAVTNTAGGPYQHQLNGDHYTMPNGTLSGSSLTMLKAVGNMVEKAGTSLEEALRMASAYPASIIGFDKELGKIQRGYRACLVSFNSQFNEVRVWGPGS